MTMNCLRCQSANNIPVQLTIAAPNTQQRQRISFQAQESIASFLGLRQCARGTTALICGLSAQECDHRRAVAVEQQLNWEKMLKTVGHTEVVKLCMFLLEKHATLDSATLHAIASYLRRVTTELQLEPMLYQVQSCRLL
jgi:hypothetical protein